MPHHNFHPKTLMLHPRVAPQVKDNPLYQRALNQFITDPLPGSREEKIHTSFDSPSFTIKINRRIRVFVVPDPMDAQVGLAIRIMDDHDYDEITKQPNSWLAKQIEKTQEVSIELPETEEKTEEPIASFHFPTAHNIEFCNQHYVLLSDKQQAIKKVSLPLIISGAPGSGKSSLLISMLKDQVLRDSTKTYLVLTESNNLIAALKKEWEELSKVEKIPFCQVDFKTPRQLHQESLAKDIKESGFSAFQSWFKSFIKELQKQGSLSGDLTALIAESEFVYAEWRAMSTYTDLKQYNDEVTDSFYPCHRHRAFLWDRLQDYRLFLKEQKLIDFAFELIPNLDSYHTCFVDEAADLSRKQLDSFGPNTLFSLGDHQQLFGSESLVPFIKSLYFKKNENLKVEHHSLPASYRCAEHIIALANFFLELKYFCLGGKKKRSTHEVDFIQPIPGMDKGNVIWVNNEDALKPLIEDKANAGFAVVTSPAFFKKAQGLFGEERVYTIQGVKGLQFETLLIYCIESKELELLKDSMREFAKDDKAASVPSLRQGYLFNGPFVSATRAQQNLYLYLPEKKKYHSLIELIQNFILSLKENSQTQEYKKTVSSKEEWQQLAEKLNLQEDNTEQLKAMQVKGLIAAAPKTEPISTYAELKEELPKAPTEPNKKGPKKSQAKPATNLNQARPQELKTPQFTLDIEKVLTSIFSASAINIYSAKLNQTKTLLDHMIVEFSERLKEIFNKGLERIEKGEVTQEQSEYFIAFFNHFKAPLKNLISKPLNKWIQKKITANESQLRDRKPEAIEAFYRMNNLNKATPQSKLEAAIQAGHISIIEDLHQEGLNFRNLSFLTKKGSLPIIPFAFLECTRERMKVIETLLNRGADINEQGDNTSPSLLALAYQEDKKFNSCLMQLLDWKADLDVGFENFFLAAVKDNNLKILKSLHKNGYLNLKLPSILPYAIGLRRPDVLEFVLSIIEYLPPIYNTGENFLAFVKKYQPSKTEEMRLLISKYSPEETIAFSPRQFASFFEFPELCKLIAQYQLNTVEGAKRYHPPAIKALLLDTQASGTLSRMIDHLMLKKDLLLDMIKQDPSAIPCILDNLRKEPALTAPLRLLIEQAITPVDSPLSQSSSVVPNEMKELKQNATVLEEQTKPTSHSNPYSQSSAPDAFFTPLTDNTAVRIHVNPPPPDNTHP